MLLAYTVLSFDLRHWLLPAAGSAEVQTELKSLAVHPEFYNSQTVLQLPVLRHYTRGNIALVAENVQVARRVLCALLYEPVPDRPISVHAPPHPL